MKHAGFSLVEVLVATTIVMVGVASLAQLSTLAAARNASAHAATMTLLLAEQKMEQLRAADAGLSPAGALSSSTVGWVDYLDGSGRLLGSVSTTPPAGAVYIRRWSVAPTPDNGGQTRVLQVVVARRWTSGSDGAPVGVTRLPDEARLVCATTPLVGS